MESWDKISAKMCGYNVFGVDLVNDLTPRAGQSGDDLGRDWGLAATRLGNNVLQSCALVDFVEGVGYSPELRAWTCRRGHMVGELAGVKVRPVGLADLRS